MSEEKSGGGISLVTKSKFSAPENFFPIVVDDFFSDPEDLVNYGKSLPKEPATDGRWPGNRSKHLWEIDEVLHNVIMSKIMSCYYDLDYIEISWKHANLVFQEIPRFSENKNDIRNKGWIHRDVPGEDQLAGLIYLTPNIDPDSGTSLYNIKSTRFNKKQVSKFKLLKTITSFFSGDSFDREEYTKNYIKHEENFFEKLRVRNIFNRLIAYDTREWHRANSYYNGDGKDARLMLVFFIGGINVFPLKRIRNNEYETLIKLQIGKK